MVMEIMSVVHQGYQEYKLIEIGIVNSCKKMVLCVQAHIMMIVKAMYVHRIKMEFMFVVQLEDQS